MSEKAFHVYKSSAGSGKTFTLAKEYLKLALQSKDAYRQILAVTFTNKATQEMKSRILGVLKELSGGLDNPMKGELKDTLGLNDQQLQERARLVHTRILHQYNRFSIVTIDSFFHQVIRSFAREMGLQGTFSIDLDFKKVLQQVIDDLLSELGEEDQKELRQWLTKFAVSKVEDGKPWDFRGDILSLANEIIRDEFKPYAEKISKLSEERDFFSNVMKQLETKKSSFEKKCFQLSNEALKKMVPHGGVDAFSHKSSGPAGLFIKVCDGDYTISEGRKNATGDLQKWLTKETIKFDSLVNFLNDEIFPIYAELVEYIETNRIDYQSIQEARRYFFTFGILFKISQKLQQYRDEKDTMLIADLPDFLRRIINDSDTPYVYEKIGARFSHYLIDEFQDTSFFQWENFKPLVKNSTDQGDLCMIVGDIKQSIYRWRGGNLQLLQQKAGQDIGDYNTIHHTLNSNWRSAETIVKFNNQLFLEVIEKAQTYFEDIDSNYQEILTNALNAFDNIEQHIENKDIEGYINIKYFESNDINSWQEQSINNTISQVEELQKNGYALRDIAILTRTQREGKLIADAFMNYKSSDNAIEGMNYEVVSAEALYLYSSLSVRFIISLLKWLNYETDSIAHAEWMFAYNELSNQKKENVFDDLKSWKSYVPKEFINQLGNLKTLPLYELVETLLRIFKLNEIKSEYTYIQGFQDAVLDYTKNEKGGIPSFLNWWENIRKERAIQIADENDAIKVLTIHKAKGLEYPIVFIPFLNWRLDHDTFSKEEILWTEATDLDPLKELPVLPLRYSGNLKDTHWADLYWKEKINAFVDNLNLLYVAFTRPINALYVGSDLPKKDTISHVGQLVYQILKNNENWSDDHCHCILGNLIQKQIRNAVSNEYGLKEYVCQSWRNKISIQMKGSSELSERIFDAQKWGIQLHRALGKIPRIEDQYKVSDELIKRELKLIINHESIEPFFTDIEEVKMEEPILLPDGGFKQIDRLIKKNGKWQVIDFKTGRPREKDKKQVREYVSILGEMGYQNPEGYLAYLDPVEVIRVV